MLSRKSLFLSTTDATESTTMAATVSMIVAIKADIPDVKRRGKSLAI